MSIKIKILRLIKESFIAKRVRKNDLLLELFTPSNILNEDELKTKEDVINKIKNKDFTSDPQEFLNSLSASKHKEMLTDYSVSDLSKMKLFKVNGYNIGYALKRMENGGNDIVAVHNNEPTVKGIGEYLMRSAIENGGCFLDHFDTPALSNLYSRMGFEEISRDKFDPQYDPDSSFRNKYGEADVIYRVYKGCKNRFKIS